MPIYIIIVALIFAVVVFLLVKKAKTDTKVTLYKTPKGYKVNIPKKIVPLYGRSFVIQDQKEAVKLILFWVDMRISECIAKYDEVEREKLRNQVLKCTFEIVNDFVIPCNLSTNGLCAGFTKGNTYIYTPVYCKWGGLDFPTFQTNTKLIKSKEDMAKLAKNDIWLTNGLNYYASDLEVRGELEIGVPVICHELEHVWYKITPDHKDVASR